MSKRKAPQLAVQKRIFVKTYYEELRRDIGGGGGSSSGSGSGSGGGGGGGGAKLSVESVYQEVNNRIEQANRSVKLQGVLTDVHVDSLAEKICQVLGREMPVQKRERRHLVESWHKHMKQHVSGRG